MAEETLQRKWEGKSTAEIRPFAAAQVWPLLIDDFCSIHKWASNIDSCHHIEGSPGQIGLTRRCTDSSISLCVDERLIAIDPQEMVFSYEVTENNVGFQSYVATIRLLPSVEGGGCKIELSFVTEPAEGWKLEDLRAYIETMLHSMAHNMETVLKSPENEDEVAAR